MNTRKHRKISRIRAARHRQRVLPIFSFGLARRGVTRRGAGRSQQSR